MYDYNVNVNDVIQLMERALPPAPTNQNENKCGGKNSNTVQAAAERTLTANSNEVSFLYANAIRLRTLVLH